MPAEGTPHSVLFVKPKPEILSPVPKSNLQRPHGQLLCSRVYLDLNIMQKPPRSETHRGSQRGIFDILLEFR